jgi:hypothetical protein
VPPAVGKKGRASIQNDGGCAMTPQSSPATLHIVRLEQDLINDTGLYEVAYSQEGKSQQQPRIRQFLGEQPLMEFLEREVGSKATEARRTIDRLRAGEHVHVPIAWSENEVSRFGLGDPRKAA